MIEMDANVYSDDRYFTRLAAAFVRGKLSHLPPQLPADEIIKAGLASSLHLQINFMRWS